MVVQFNTAINSLVDLLQWRAMDAPSRRLYTFLGDPGAEESMLSYGELHERACSIGAMLQEVVPPGARALLLYPPGLDYITGFCGCLYAAVVAVPAYPPDPMRIDRTLPRLRAMVKDAGATVILTTRAILAIADFVLEQAPELRSLRWIATDTLPAAGEHSWRRPSLSSNTLAFLQYTSGSTDDPKGVMLSHDNLLHNLKLISHAFQIRPDDVGVIWLPPYHDMGLIGGILEPLYSGFEMALMSPVSFLRRPIRWLEAISHLRATVSGGPNFAFDLCARKVSATEIERLDLSSWEVAFCGAEPIRAETLDRFSAVFERCGFRREAVYPCYGLAESTLIVSGGDRAKRPVVHTLEAEALTRHRAVHGEPSSSGARTHVGCGTALPELEISIVDPDTLRRRAVGEVGEIWVSGPSIARGYWGKPDETERTFHGRPLDGGSRRYLRTGDLGLLLDDGELIVTGRLKDVIIIRGRNHYPQDIERTVEQCHKAVRPGCSAAFSLDVASGEQLAVVAEVSPEVSSGTDPASCEAIANAIRHAISQQHELFVHTVVLLPPNTIFKTSSGKIQRWATRRALASGNLPVVARIDDVEAVTGDGVTDLGADSESSGSERAGCAVRAALATAPVSERGGLLLALLRHELARELRQDPARIDPGAAAAALGLDSLGMLAVEGRLEAVLTMPLPAAFLWRHATLTAAAEELAAVWEAGEASPRSASTRGAGSAGASATGDTAAVSSGQARLWFLDKLLPDSAVYNVFSGLRLSGPLDEAALDRSLTALVERHAVLRTTFVAGADGSPYAVITPPAPVALAAIDLCGRPPEVCEVELVALGRTESRRPFDLTAGPLFRATLVRLAEDAHALLLTMHHIVTDGWSMGILTRELAALYRQARRGEPPSLPPAPRYDEYARRPHAAGSALDAQREFWKRKLDGLPRLELPIARAHSGPPSPRGATQRFSLPAELVDRVREVARQRGTTLFTAMLAGFTALLHRYSGQTDIGIGTVAANRGRPEHRNLVGFLANTLVLRIDAAHDPSFVELIDRSRRTVSEALAHVELPFDDVVRIARATADLDRNQLFQAAFFMESLPPLDLEVPGMMWAPILDVLDGSVEDTAKFDLTLMMAEPMSRGGASLACQYRTDQFDEPSIQRLVAHFEVLLRALCETPSRPVSSLALLTEPERRRMLTDWNATAADYPRGTTIYRLFAEQVARTPEATAVTFGDVALRYAELDRRSSRLAARLAASGVGPEARVGLYLERSAELVVGLLGILKSGAAYVPLDPDYPAERVAFVLTDSGVSALVTQEHLAAELPDPRCPVLWIDDAAAASETLPAPAIDPASLAYVIYTSGSTGRPKGVMVTHGSVVNFFASMDRYVGAEPPGVFLALTSVAFDISVLELLWTLTRGFHVVVHAEQPTTALRTQRSRPATRTVPEQIAAYGVTHLQCTPSLARGLLFDPHAERAFAGLRALVVGGEALPAPLAARLHACAPGRVINMYGPTETTIWSATHAVQPDETGAVVSIGTPIGNTALYVLDGRLEPVPVGVTGELYIGGAGLARGYHGRAELTAERFLPDPFAERGARMYRTGDLARFRDDGSIDFLGRVDQQIKLRGFRIELGEIEATLAEHPDVREVAVAIREQGADDQWLVAYVVPRGQRPPDAEELRRLARQRLPDYMVPSAVLVLQAMPMTPNGKLDRKALPAPEAHAAETRRYEAPQGEVEHALAAIWAEFLDVERVGRQDNFFERGGHSLLAMRLSSRVQTRFDVIFPLVAVFANPTLVEMAKAVAEGSRQALPKLTPVSREAALPLSFAQQRLWFLAQFEGGDAAYHIPAVLHLSGVLDRSALRAALDRVVARHEALRTTFVDVDGQPMQVIAPADCGFAVMERDLRHVQGAAQHATIHRLSLEEAAKPFDLSKGPLIRGQLLQAADEQHVLLITQHHIISDGWSIGVLARELGALYRAFAAGEKDPLPPLGIQYADYAAWQRRWLSGERLEAQSKYWRRQLADAPVLLELPLDRPRPAQQSLSGAALEVTIDAALTRELKRLSQQHGATLFMTVLAAWAAVLSRLSGQQDVVIGTATANRNQPEVLGLIGFFVNTLALRIDGSGEPDVAELLSRVRRTVLAGQEHQDLPFEQVVEIVQPSRRLSHTPLFQVMFAWQSEGEGRLDLPGLHVRTSAGPLEMVKFDLELSLTEDNGAVAGHIRYATALFDGATIERHRGYLFAILRAMVADASQPVHRIDLLSPAERELLLYTWNQTQAAYPADRGVHAVFESQTAASPDAIAVIHGTNQLSYAELNAKANRLAHRLITCGVTAGDRVVTLLPRSTSLIVAELAILKAGAAYVPIDPQVPMERQAWLIADCGAKHMVTDAGGTAHAVPALQVDLPSDEQANSSNPDLALSSEMPAYIMYTSGSAGTPKGVIVPHRGVHRLVRDNGYMEFRPSDHVAVAANPGFDVATMEVWGPLLNGGTCVVIDQATLLAFEHFRDTVRALRVSVMCLAGGLFNQIADEVRDIFRWLRVLLAGGEALDPKTIQQVLLTDAPGQLINAYGPTEATTFATTYPITTCDGQTPLPIGRPISNTSIYLLDAHRQPVPLGVVGEVCIGGAGVALGYLNRPDLTGERFVPDPFGAQPHATMYLTGDRARYRADGNIEYLGRIDHQVKIRGCRVELGEVEARVREHPTVRDSVVTAYEDVPGNKRLIAYVVPQLDVPFEAAALRDHLARQLPDYMIPSAFVQLSHLPLTTNGKVDRKALPAPDAEAVITRAYEPPVGELESVIAAIWSELLGIERVGRHDHFFELGGHSLLATRVISRLRRLASDLPVRAVFEYPTVAALAELLSDSQSPPAHSAIIAKAGGDAAAATWIDAARHEEDAADRMPPPRSTPRDCELALSFAQQRLWFLDQLNPGSASYNISFALRLRGALRVEPLRMAFEQIVWRHEVLRTTFYVHKGHPLQVIHPPEPWELPVIDLSGRTDMEPEIEVHRHVQEQARQTFALDKGPLLRAALLRLRNDDCVLSMCMHHIVSDGWSVGVMIEEVATLYQAFCSGQGSPLPSLALQYADYAAWQRSWLTGEVLAAQLAYWRDKLAAAPVLELPTDRPRPAVRSDRGSSYFFTLPGSLMDAVRQVSLRGGATPFMVLLGAFHVLLWRYSGQHDFCVGTPIANRTRPEFESLMGFFVNTLVMRADLSGDPSFLELLRQVKDTALGAYAHQDIPFEHLVDELSPSRTLSHPPLFQVMFALQNAPMSAPHLDGLDISVLPVGTGTAKFDLTLSLTESPQGLEGQLEYSEDLFDHATITRMAGHYRSLLEAIAADPNRRIGTLPLLGLEERTRLLEAGLVPGGQDAEAQCVHLQIQEQAQRRPEVVALQLEGRRLGYGELEALASRGARWLVSRGVRPGERVALCAERWDEVLVGALATWKAGAVVDFDRGSENRPALGPGWLDALGAFLDERAADDVPMDAATSVAVVLDGCEVDHVILVRVAGALGRALKLAATERVIVERTRPPLLELVAVAMSGATTVELGDGSKAPQRGATVALLSPRSLSALPAEVTASLRAVIVDGPLVAGNALRQRGCEYTVARWIPPGLLLIEADSPAIEVHVLEPHFDPAPLGLWGELCLGAGLSPATAQAQARFLPHPWDRRVGATLYRTGQRVRRCSNGLLQWFEPERPRPVIAQDAAIQHQHTAPLSDTEQGLLAIWRQFLAVDSLGPHDNFFDLGGNSLLSVVLMAQVQDAFDVELPVRVLFDGPTVAAVAAYIDNARRPARVPDVSVTSSSSLLLPLRTVGACPPLFFVHAISGTAVTYRDLAEHIGDDQPFYGLHAVGVDDDAAPSKDVREMACRYVEAVRSVQPEGPYHLGGWSFGGLVALEMAYQLRSMGQPVSTLVLVDTWALELDRYSVDDMTIIETLARELGIEVSPKEIASLPPEALVPRVAALAAQAWLVQADVAERRIRRFARVIAAHLDAASRYVAPPYREPITLLRAKDLPTAAIEERLKIDPSCGWSTRTGLQVREHVVPGNHFSVIRPPHVRVLADTLRSVLSRTI